MTSTEVSLEIAAVVLASVIILIIIIWYWFYYRKRESSQKGMSDYDSSGSSYWDEDPDQNNIPNYLTSVDNNYG